MKKTKEMKKKKKRRGGGGREEGEGDEDMGVGTPGVAPKPNENTWCLFFVCRVLAIVYACTYCV